MTVNWTRVRELLEAGWGQGEYLEDRGTHEEYCLLGAIGQVTVGDPWVWDNTVERWLTDELVAFVGKLEKAGLVSAWIGEDTAIEAIVRFNDRGDQTLDEVLSAVRLMEQP